MEETHYDWFGTLRYQPGWPINMEVVEKKTENFLIWLNEKCLRMGSKKTTITFWSILTFFPFLDPILSFISYGRL